MGIYGDLFGDLWGSLWALSRDLSGDLWGSLGVVGISLHPGTDLPETLNSSVLKKAEIPARVQSIGILSQILTFLDWAR